MVSGESLPSFEEGDKLWFKDDGEVAEIINRFTEDGTKGVRVRRYNYGRDEIMRSPVRVRTIPEEDLWEQAQGQKVEVLDT